jgi:hypothetical protein
VVASLATKVFAKCSLNEYVATSPDWRGTVIHALAEPKVTVAVLDLVDLARAGGFLDELAGAGYSAAGPPW